MEKMKALRSHFTLMEVMIAALVFTLSAVVSMQIIGTTRANYLRDSTRWTHRNAVTNAVEYFLMCGADAVIPDGLLPEGYSAQCALYDIEEELPEDARESINSWRLGEYVVSIYKPGGDLLEEVVVRKLVREEDVGYVNTVGE